jgi:DNA polymerase-4
VPLPIEQQARPLRYLFLDLNAYFASVEQQERPELRGKPVGVCPVMADSSFIIAASYEAKRFGVKTGTRIGDAREMCPGIQLVDARPQVYVAYHKRVIEVAESVLPVEEVCSIDEMRFRLLGKEKEPGAARELGLKMKKAIADGVGQCMLCSIGIAPNPFLAKLGTELQKPDGLVIIQADDLPHRLFGLKLTDFTGINKRMEARLNGAGIFDARQMLSASKEELRRAFGSVIGERWWYLLRGFELKVETRDRQSLGHSHVLPPELRTDQGCREVLLRLLQKASARLRAEHLWTSSMTIYVSCFEKSWDCRVKLPPTQDTVTLNEYFLEAWEGRDFVKPRSVGVTFHELQEAEQVTPSLFEETADRAELNEAVDVLNQKFGKNTIYLAGMERSKNTASEKIAFNKTWLFSEGKGDNALPDGEWIDTFRGLRTKDD